MIILKRKIKKGQKREHLKLDSSEKVNSENDKSEKETSGKGQFVKGTKMNNVNSEKEHLQTDTSDK